MHLGDVHGWVWEQEGSQCVPVGGGSSWNCLSGRKTSKPKEAVLQGKECNVSEMSRRLRMEETLSDLGRRRSFLSSQGMVVVQLLSLLSR